MLIIQYDGYVETISTDTPNLEIENAFMKGNVLPILLDNQIIWIRPQEII